MPSLRSTHVKNLKEVNRKFLSIKCGVKNKKKGVAEEIRRMAKDKEKYSMS